ncbi:DUF5063 domain-containing protein [Pseudactinotalea sp. Z1739]|uniref:DUF5063 domain-containing protein n=1 Tax=Pseudactinotalea sp. Z1739 TaxID=3413028 RepID=UPI003C7C57E3
MEASLDADLRVLGTATAAVAEQFLSTTKEVASGSSPDVAIPLLLLAVSDLVTAGARLGAITDVVPAHRFEPDDGPEVDSEPLRVSLANVLDGLDAYSEVIDPLISADTGTARLSDDLADIATALSTGLQHHRAGHPDEALWWWQFSYLSVWGERATSATRVLISLIAHLRLDVDDEVAADAEFRALHATPGEVPADGRPSRGTPASGD